ncbi:hypothetical protein SAMN04489834_3427 [Microterricola viridarii]|uniref:Uncharacterized protein n=2 Tax=Microterricola viridarii TaxID=412690 RepID=A0A1H1ZEG5_9MICO|nr:hypothetical protein SAMN04489834_3427 [Microterricola viridarii]
MFGVYVGGFLFILAGTLAYTGRWKGWAFARPVLSYGIGFGCLYMGIAVVLGWTAATVLPDSMNILFIILVSISGALVLLTLISQWWLPRFLQPRWFRELRAEQHRTYGPGWGRKA